MIHIRVMYVRFSFSDALTSCSCSKLWIDTLHTGICLCLAGRVFVCMCRGVFKGTFCGLIIIIIIIAMDPDGNDELGIFFDMQ